MKNLKILNCALIVLSLTSCVNNNKLDTVNYYLNEDKNDTIRASDSSILKVERHRNNELLSILFFEDRLPKKLIEYMKVNGEERPNQMYVFDEKGDTINGKSIYYDLYCVNDTITSSEFYQFKVVLSGHLLDSSILYLCDYNSDFNIKSDSSCTVVRMNNFEGPALAVKKKEKGWNYVRGRIDNYTVFPKSKNIKGEDSTSIVEVYFIDSFYVMP